MTVTFLPASVEFKVYGVAVTIGGTETLISHSASSTHNSVDADTKAKTGLTESLLRLSVGLEACVDIQRDLATAIAQAN